MSSACCGSQRACLHVPPSCKHAVCAIRACQAYKQSLVACHMSHVSQPASQPASEPDHKLYVWPAAASTAVSNKHKDTCTARAAAKLQMHRIHTRHVTKKRKTCQCQQLPSKRQKQQNCRYISRAAANSSCFRCDKQHTCTCPVVQTYSLAHRCRAVETCKKQAF